MRKITLLKTIMLALMMLVGSESVKAQTIINFDTDANWIQAGSTSFTSYAAHGYSESGVTIQGTNVLRNTTATQDGFAGANGTYSMRVGNTAASQVLITVASGGLANFSLKVRRWDGTPIPDYTVKYSTDGGTLWTSLTNINGTLLTNSDFQTYSSGNINSSASNIKIEIKNTGTTERIMIDDFAWTGFSSSCTTSSLAFATSPIEKLVTDLNFTITPTTNSTGAITYSSSVETVATVNPNTGEVDILGAGSTEITASQAADATYCSNTTKYTLNVATSTPTITITEVTVPAFSAIVGSTDTETINVSGANLTADIILTIDGTNAALFSVNSPLPSTGGVATIIYTPTAPGTHTATLRLNSTGAAEETRTLSGTATFATPVATDANGVSQSGFTANWDEVSGATEYELSVYTKAAGGNASDLFISEYVEGSSYNKAIEIYNGTGANVDLSTYSIFKQVNGAGAYGNELMLSGTLTNGDTYVIAYVSGTNSASAAILAVTDLQTSSSAINFNGNDAVALFKSGLQIDEVGIFNQVDTWGTDVTLIRKSSAVVPKVTYDVNDWTVEAKDYVNNLGVHSVFLNTPIAGSPFTVTGANTKSITGLSPQTTYYYTVVAKNGLLSSVSSNEISVSTSPSTGLDNLKGNVIVYTLNGNVVFNSAANQTIEIFNAVGQRIVSKNTVEGLNTIAIAQKGVMLVKVGNQVSKVIL